MSDDQRALVAALGERFIARKEVKARQFDNGTGYQPVKATSGEYLPFKMSDFAAHFSGSATFGHYLVNTDNQCKLFAYDIDLRKMQPDPNKANYWVPVYDPIAGRILATGEAFDDKCIGFDPREHWKGGDGPIKDLLRLQMRCLAEGLAYRIYRLTDGKMHVAVATSGGKGVHVYAFTGLHDAESVRNLGIQIIKDSGSFVESKGNNFFRHWRGYECFEVEVFPKQASIDDGGFGNLLALPLGRHQATRQAKYFLDLTNGYDQPFQVLDPMAALTNRLPWGNDEARRSAEKSAVVMHAVGFQQEGA